MSSAASASAKLIVASKAAAGRHYGGAREGDGGQHAALTRSGTEDLAQVAGEEEEEGGGDHLQQDADLHGVLVVDVVIDYLLGGFLDVGRLSADEEPDDHDDDEGNARQGHKPLESLSSSASS